MLEQSANSNTRNTEIVIDCNYSSSGVGSLDSGVVSQSLSSVQRCHFIFLYFFGCLFLSFVLRRRRRAVFRLPNAFLATAGIGGIFRRFGGSISSFVLFHVSPTISRFAKREGAVGMQVLLIRESFAFTISLRRRSRLFMLSRAVILMRVS